MSSRRPSCDCRRLAKADIQAFSRILWTSTTLVLIIESTPKKNPCRGHHQPLPTAQLKAAGDVPWPCCLSHSDQIWNCLFLIQGKPENVCFSFRSNLKMFVSHSGQTWKYLFIIQVKPKYFSFSFGSNRKRFVSHSGQTWKCLFLIQVKPKTVRFSLKSNLKLFLSHPGQS